MSSNSLVRYAAVFSGAAAGVFLALAPAQAEGPGTASAALSVPAAHSARPQPPACVVSAERVRFAQPLSRVAERLADGRPVKIVAFGSSSTEGAGASKPSASYPSRLAEELARWFPDNQITVLNRGVGGNDAADMLARLDSDVIAERPD